jgi:predicted component of type VI protein secretion system
LLIRYGPTLQRFKNLPVIIGKSGECHFKIDHDGLSNKHAEIFFRDGQYWVRDLTGTQSVFVDGRAIATEAPLMPDNKLALTHQGPTFRFLGDGRLDEVKE